MCKYLVQIKYKFGIACWQLPEYDLKTKNRGKNAKWFQILAFNLNRYLLWGQHLKMSEKNSVSFEWRTFHERNAIYKVKKCMLKLMLKKHTENFLSKKVDLQWRWRWRAVLRNENYFLQLFILIFRISSFVRTIQITFTMHDERHEHRFSLSTRKC